MVLAPLDVGQQNAGPRGAKRKAALTPVGRTPGSASGSVKRKFVVGDVV